MCDILLFALFDFITFRNIPSNLFLHIFAAMIFFQQLVEAFPHVETHCSVLACAEESPFAKMYKTKGFLVSFAHLFFCG